MNHEFNGYWRDDGRVGTRNHVLILPLSPAVSATATTVQLATPGTVSVEIQQDVDPAVEGYALAIRTLSGWVDHPNVYATVLLALDARDALVEELLTRIAPHVKYRLVTFDQEGGRRAAALKASQVARDYLYDALAVPRRPAPLRHLLLATECGGSDACSGLSANPSLGYASDLLIQQGGHLDFGGNDRINWSRAHSCRPRRHAGYCRSHLGNRWPRRTCGDADGCRLPWRAAGTGEHCGRDHDHRRKVVRLRPQRRRKPGG